VMIGVGGFGGFTLKALCESPQVRLVGLSDAVPAVAERAGKEAKVPAYSDNRRLLAETRPAAVFLAVPPAEIPTLVEACARRDLHVWTELPLASSLDEGVELVRQMERAGLKLAVGTQWRFAAGYQAVRQLLGELGRLLLIRAHYLFNWGQELGWRGDAESGGGAMRELGYHLVDLLVGLLGLPDEVYGVSTGGKRPAVSGGKDSSRPLYDTDDAAAAIFRYVSGTTATLAVGRRSGPVSEELALHGERGSLIANAEVCLLRDADGNVLDRIEETAPPAAVFRRQIEAFVHAVQTDAKSYECSGLENLLNLAVIEATYLSDRTSQPENPLHLLKTRGLTTEECLARRPVEPPSSLSL